jgi:hypothetical protein
MCSPGRGLGVFATESIAWRELDCLKWTLALVPDELPMLDHGRIDSFIQPRADGALYYLGGPAHLLNAACNEHANISFKCNPSNNKRAVKTTDAIAKGQELTALYGCCHHFDIFCECGQSLLSQGIPDARAVQQMHIPIATQYRTHRFNEFATSDYVAALTSELCDIERLIDEIRGVYEDFDTSERWVCKQKRIVFS